VARSRRARRRTARARDGGRGPRDPKDDFYLWTAWAGGASHVVSKDPHLLALEHFRGAQIGDPVAFLKGLRGRPDPVVAEPSVEFSPSMRRRKARR
jgi:hypothetical protein